MDIFEPEVLPSARITLPPKTLSKETTLITDSPLLTSNANIDTSAEVEDVEQLTTNVPSDFLIADSTTQSNTESPVVSTPSSQSVNEITIITTEIPPFTESTVNNSPQDSTPNTLTETNTPKLKILKKIRKKIIKTTTFKPVVEELSEDILAAASNSGEARRAPSKVRILFRLYFQ